MSNRPRKSEPNLQNIVTSTELGTLIKEALRLQAQQTPAERAAAKREAAIDFAYSNLTCTGRRPYITRELVEEQYDKINRDWECQHCGYPARIYGHCPECGKLAKR